MDVACFDDQGNKVTDQEGERLLALFLVVRYIFLMMMIVPALISTYFAKYEDVWHHGDFITYTDRGTVKVFGRSDATLNPGGVRIGNVLDPSTNGTD